MTLNISYEVTLKSDGVVVDTPKVLSNTDSTQSTTKYASTTVPNAGTKKLDLILYPTASVNGDPAKEVTINLEDLEITSIKILHIKCTNNFFYKFGQTENELDTNHYNKCKLFFRDYGDIISSANFQPPDPTIKLIRFLNPDNLNSGPIQISLTVITSYQD